AAITIAVVLAPIVGVSSAHAQMNAPLSGQTETAGRPTATSATQGGAVATATTTAPSAPSAPHGTATVTFPLQPAAPVTAVPARPSTPSAVPPAAVPVSAPVAPTPPASEPERRMTRVEIRLAPEQRVGDATRSLLEMQADTSRPDRKSVVKGKEDDRRDRGSR